MEKKEWIVEESDYGDEIWFGGRGGGLIEVGGWYNGGEKRNPEKWGELRSEARLISSAPDLLQALQLAVKQNMHDMVMTGEELRICEAAISKALGK